MRVLVISGGGGLYQRFLVKLVDPLDYLLLVLLELGDTLLERLKMVFGLELFLLYKDEKLGFYVFDVNWEGGGGMRCGFRAKGNIEIRLSGRSLFLLVL